MTTPGKQRAVSSWALFLRFAAVVIALDVYAAGIYVLWGAVRVPLFLKWTGVAVALAGIYALWRVVPLLWRAVRKPLFLKWAAVVVALGVYAAGIYVLWGAVREPLFLKWAAVVAALGVYSAGIYVLWGAVRKPLFLKWAAVVAALGLCAVGILLLWGVWEGTPIAAAFTRVGGASQVETALEASRFWLTPPQYAVITPTHSSQLMLGAAQCAIVHDAPLLFTSPARKREVNARISDWRKIRKRQGIANIHVILIRSRLDVTKCVGKKRRADIARLSTLELTAPIFRLSRVRPVQTLAPVVVFAAAIEPGHPPDVAVGLALAAHLARTTLERVSLVVLPHYLESAPELEKMLQSQHELVTGGVILGQTPTVPEDTRALLRQLLTSRDRRGVLAQVQNNLGSVGTLIAALLALVGVATATRIAGPIVIDRLERAERERAEREHAERERAEREHAKREHADQERADGEHADQGSARPATEDVDVRMKKSWIGRRMQEESDWLIALGKYRDVTVWLRSGRQVTGIIEDQTPGKVRDATVFRIKNRLFEASDADSRQEVSTPMPEAKYAYVLVSVREIEQIHFNDSKSAATNASQKLVLPGRSDPVAHTRHSAPGRS